MQPSLDLIEAVTNAVADAVVAEAVRHHARHQICSALLE
jgi:hypothetical protein